jgi:hypothetical protein
MAEHINCRNRCNTWKLSRLRMIAQYQKSVKFLCSGRNSEQFSGFQSKVENSRFSGILWSITRCLSQTFWWHVLVSKHSQTIWKLQFLVQCLKVVLHCQWLRVMCLKFLTLLKLKAASQHWNVLWLSLYFLC